MYTESCKQVAADPTGHKKGFRKKFRICNVFVLWGAAAMPTVYPVFIHPWSGGLWMDHIAPFDVKLLLSL